MASERDESLGTADTTEMVETLKREMNRLSEQVQGMMGERAGQLRETAQQMTGDMERIIRENPLPAIGVAAGAGLLLALMMRRGSTQRSELPRRQLERLMANFEEAIETAKARGADVREDRGERALLDRLTDAVSGLLEGSRSTASSVASAGERAARNVASAGERTARSIADRLTGNGR